MTSPSCMIFVLCIQLTSADTGYPTTDEDPDDMYAMVDYLFFVLGILLIAWLVKEAQGKVEYANSKRDDDVPKSVDVSQPAPATQVKAKSGGEWEQSTEDDCSTLVSYIQSGTKESTEKVDPINWKFIKESDKVRLSQAEHNGSEWKCLRCSTYVKAPPRFCWKMLMERDAMFKVDDMLEACKVVEQDEEANMEIRWMKYKAMWPTAGRDFCVMTQGKEYSPQKFVVSSKSVERSSVPPAEPYTRGEVILSGYLVRASEEGCIVTLYSHLDLKGNIPSFIINQLGTSAPIKMLGLIRGYCEREHQANPGKYS